MKTLQVTDGKGSVSMRSDSCVKVQVPGLLEGHCFHTIPVAFLYSSLLKRDSSSLCKIEKLPDCLTRSR